MTQGCWLLQTTGMLEIESTIPAPQVPPRERYPFYDMRVGDSFQVRGQDRIKNARAAAWMFARRHPGVRFTSRKTVDGCRIWRVA